MKPSSRWLMYLVQSCSETLHSENEKGSKMKHAQPCGFRDDREIYFAIIPPPKSQLELGQSFADQNHMPVFGQFLSGTFMNL
ncbi:MAG: hypothetical protein ACKOHM_06960 [Spartobacteria bacterium]